MKKYTVALAILLACACVRGAETTTVEVEEGTVVVKTSTGEVPAKTGDTVVADGTQVNLTTPDFDALVTQLGADEFGKRDAAQAALVEAGKAALPALKKALASDDPEVRLRVSALINRIEPQLGLEQEAPRPEDAHGLAVRPVIRVFRDRAAFLVEANKQVDVRVNDRVARPEAGNPKGTAASSTRITVDGKTFEVSGDGGNVSVNSKDGQITIQSGKITLTGDSATLKSGDKTYDISAAKNVSITIRGDDVKVDVSGAAKSPEKQETP